MASPYEILGVDPDAGRETVEKRYRERVKEAHPDAGGSAEEFKRVKEAYQEIVEGAPDVGGPSGTGDADRSSTGATQDPSSGTGSASGSGTGSASGSGTGSASSSGTNRTSSDRTYGSRNQGGTTSGRSSQSSGSYTGRGRQRRASETDRSDRSSTSDGGGMGATRRAFLYGLPPLVGAGALAHREGLTSRFTSDSAAEGSTTQEETVSREVGPEDLFDVPFQASAGSTIFFTVDGADSSDWVNVYTESEYESVEEHWNETGEFDRGDPLRTVLTEDGYVCDIPEDGTYVVLVKLWSGPPDDPREPRTVEISYEIPA